MSAGSIQKHRMLFLAGVLHAFTHLYQVALMPLYLLIQKNFKLESEAGATLLVTVMLLANFLPSYFMGLAADKLSRKKLLGWGLGMNALGFILLSWSPNYVCALGSVALAGLGGSFFHPAATAMVARLYPVGTGRALGLLGIGASVGFCFSPIYTGWRATMLQPSMGAAAWRQPVLELGLFGLVMAGVFAWLAHEEGPLPTLGKQSNVAEKIFPNATLWLLFFAASLAFSLRDFTGMSMSSLGSLFLQKAHNYDPKFTGLAISGIFLTSAISNPLFGGFSDSGRGKWTMAVLIVAAAMVALFPHVPSRWTIPVFAIYGFFFMASYPMVEAAVMQSVPDAVRGRVFGLFITVGGMIGNLSHWIVGAWVKGLGNAAHSVNSYFSIYAVLAIFILISLAGLPALHAIRRREHLEAA
jgi:MFS family permease